MAIEAYPFDNQNTTEGQYGLIAELWADSGVVGSYGDTSLQVTADSSGMHVTFNLGAGIFKGVRVSVHTAAEQRGVAASHPTLSRIDAAICRVDRTANTADVLVLTGTPAVTPVRPPLTQTESGIYEHLLADIAVPAGAVTIAAGQVTDRRNWLGSRVGVWTTQTRPANPRRYQTLGYNVSLGSAGAWEFWVGPGPDDWVPLVPATVDNALRWGGYELIVSSTPPPVTPNAIWLEPTA